MADIGRGNYRYRRTGLDMADEIFQFLLVGIIGIYGQSFGLAVAIDRGGAGRRRDVFQVSTSPHMVTVCLFIANNIQLCRKGKSAGHFQDSLSRSFHTVFKDQGCCHMVPAADAVLVADGIDLLHLAEQVAQIINIMQVQIEQASAAVFGTAIPTRSRRDAPKGGWHGHT